MGRGYRKGGSSTTAQKDKFFRDTLTATSGGPFLVGGSVLFFDTADSHGEEINGRGLAAQCSARKLHFLWRCELFPKSTGVEHPVEKKSGEKSWLHSVPATRIAPKANE